MTSQCKRLKRCVSQRLRVWNTFFPCGENTSRWDAEWLEYRPHVFKIEWLQSISHSYFHLYKSLDINVLSDVVATHDMIVASSASFIPLGVFLSRLPMAPTKTPKEASDKKHLHIKRLRKHYLGLSVR